MNRLLRKICIIEDNPEVIERELLRRQMRKQNITYAIDNRSVTINQGQLPAAPWLDAITTSCREVAQHRSLLVDTGQPCSKDQGL
jgi:hypothetical protein